MVIFGAKHIKFWNLKGINLTVSKGVLDKIGIGEIEIKFSVNFAFQEKFYVTGTHNGNF